MGALADAISGQQQAAPAPVAGAAPAFNPFAGLVSSAPAPAPPAPGVTPAYSGGGLFGMIGNLYRDVVNVPTGLYNLAGMAVGEAIHHPLDVAIESGTLGLVDKPDVNVLTPRFVAKIPIDFVSNLKSFYLSKDVLSHMYEHPLEPVLDVATVAGGIGVLGRVATATGTVAATEGAALGAEEAASTVASEVAATEAANAAVGSAETASAVLPPAGGMAGAVGRAIARQSPTVAEWMAKNSQLLADYRAAALARTDVPGALQAGEDVRQAAATADAMGVIQAQGAPIVGTVKSGVQAVGDVARQWAALDPQTRWAQFLDISNPEALAIADPTSGATFNVEPGYNPFVRAVWSDPIRTKLLTETVPQWEQRVLEPLRAEAKLAEDAGTVLDPQVSARLAQAEAALGRMSEQGAQLVANRGYAGSMFIKRQIEHSIGQLVSHYAIGAMTKRKDVAFDLADIAKGLQEAGQLPEDVAGRLHLSLEGLDSAVGTTFSPEELSGILQTKGWQTPEDAARDYVFQTGNYQMLTPDEGNSLLRMVKDGQIPMQGLWRYIPDPALASSPERAAFEAKFRATADAAGIAPQHQDLLMAMYDSGAKAAEANTGRTAAETFANMDMQFSPEWTPVPGKELQQGPEAAMEARAKLKQLAPDVNIDGAVRRVQLGLNDHISATEAPYSADQAATILWDRAQNIVTDELNAVEKRMRELPLTQRRKFATYADKLRAVAENGDQAAWDALRKTKLGKDITTRISNELGSMELAQKVGSEIRGATLFGPEFKTLTRIFSTGDFTTYVHEFGHVLRRVLPQDVQDVLRTVYQEKVHPGQTWEQIAAATPPEELFQKPPEPPEVTPEAAKADVQAHMDGFAKLEQAVSGPQDAIIAPSEADVQVMDNVEEQMASQRTGGGDHLYPGTHAWNELKAQGVHVTDEAAWADVPTDLAPGSHVAFAGDAVDNGDVGTVVMLDPKKDVQLGNEILASKYEQFVTMDPADYEKMPIVYQYGDMKVAMEGNHRIFRARQAGEAKLKVLLVDGKTKISDLIDTAAPEASAAVERAAAVERWTKELNSAPKAEELAAAMERNGLDYASGQAVNDRAFMLFSDGKPSTAKKTLWNKLSAKGRAEWLDKGAQELAPVEQSTAAGITSEMTVAQEQAAQEDFAARLAQAAPPENAAAPVAAPGAGATEVPPVAPPPATAPPKGMGPGWTRPMEEAFADDFERWFLKGLKPDSPSVLPAFRIVGQQLVDLWRQVRGVVADTGTVPDEAARVFDQYVGDVFTQMRSKGDQPVPEALYLGRRRVRTLNVPDAGQRWGDGTQVEQMPGPDGTINVQNLRSRAVDAASTTVPTLRQMFGKQVTTGLKDMKVLTERVDDGVKVMDAIRSRVLIPSWKEGDSYIEALSSKFQVLGVEDTRGVAGTGGMTGLKAYVVDPAHPDIVQEVEFTTTLGSKHRDALYAHDQALNKIERDYVNEEQAVARLSQSTNPNQAGVQQALEEHMKALDELTIQREAGRRYMEGYNEMLRDQVATDFGQPIARDGFRQAMEGFRLFVAKHSERDLFERGYADFQRLFERAYLPLRIKSAPDENVIDIMEGNSTEAKSAYTLDSERAAQGLPQPLYFPHMSEPDRFAYSIPNSQGMRKLAKNPNLRGTTGTLFKEGEYVTDPFQVYSIRAARAIKMQDVFAKVQDITRMYGRPISHPNALQPGEYLFAPDFATAFYRASVGVDDRLSALVGKLDDTQILSAWKEMSAQMGRPLAATDVITEGLTKSLGLSDKEGAALYQAVLEAIPKSQRELVGVTRRGLDLYAVPENVMKNLADQTKRMGVNNFTVAWDSYTHLWRALALYGSPRWIMNNFIGNISMAALEGVKLREVLSAATDRTDRWYMQELSKMTGRASEIDRGWFGSSDLYPAELAGRGAETDVGMLERRALSALKASPVDIGKPFRVWKDFIKGFNTDMENIFRETGFVTGVRRQMTGDVLDLPSMRNALRSSWTSKEDMARMLKEGITPAGFDRGMNLMVKTFGDFSTLSPFERNVIRRYIAPFYGFYRHVAKMLFRAPFSHPFKSQLVAQLAREDQAMRAQFGPLPGYTDQMAPFGPVGPDGHMTFLSVAGPNPFNPFADLGLSVLHPVIQAGIEMVTGRDTFTGQEFTDPNVVTPYGSDQRFRIIRGPDGQPMDAVPVDKVTPSLGEELLSQFPFYPQLKSLAAGGRPYDTEGVIGSINNPVLNSQGQVSSPYGIGNFVGQQAGVNIKNYDIASYQARLEQERQAALQMALNQWATSQGAA